MAKVKEALARGEIVTTRTRKPKEKAEIKQVDTWHTERPNPMKEKAEYTALPTGMVKVIALRDYVGMSDVIYSGEVFLVPERRYKSLQARGYVECYDGEKPVIDKR